MTLTTVWATVGHTSSEGRLFTWVDGRTPWVVRTLKTGLARSGVGLLLVVALALILRALVPTRNTIPSSWAVVFVALFAAALAFVTAFAAVARMARADGTDFDSL